MGTVSLGEGYFKGTNSPILRGISRIGSNPPSSAVSVLRAIIRFMGNDPVITFKAVLIAIPAIVTVIGFSIGVRPWNLRGLVFPDGGCRF